MSDLLSRPLRDPSLLIRWFLFAAIFVSVAVFDLGAQKPFDSVKWATVWFFVSLALGVFLFQLLRGRERAGASLMGWLALAFLGSTAVSTVLSHSRWTAFLGWYGRYTGLLTTVIFVAAFFIIATVYRGRADRVRQLIWAIGAASIALVVYILMQWTGVDPIRWATTAGTSPGLKYFGTMGNADFAGGWLGLTVPCVFYAFRRADVVWKRALAGLWGVAQIWCLWLTSARNGMAALVLGAAVLLFVYRKSLPRILRIGAALAVAAVIAVAGVVAVSALSGSAPSRSAQTVLRSNTVKVRGYWWLAGLKIAAHHPVFGTGPDTFVSEYEQYLPAAAAKVADAEIADKPHNVFIDHLATRGLVGTGVYLALLVVAFVRGYRRTRDGPPDEQLVVATLLALLGSYVAQAFFSIDVIPIAFMGWIVLGAIAALADPPRAKDAARPASSRRTLAAVAALVVMVLVAALGTAPLKADHEARTASRITQAEGSLDDVTLHYDRARFWHPFEPIHPGAEGDYLQKRASSETDELTKRDLLVQSVDFYRKMLSLQPTYHLWMMTLAKGLGDLAATGGASFESSERWFKRAAARAPYDWRVHTSYGDMLYTWAKTKHEAAPACRALAEYKRARLMRGRREAAPTLGYGRTLLALGQIQKAIHPLEVATQVDPENTNAQRLLDSTRELLKHPPKVKVVTC